MSILAIPDGGLQLEGSESEFLPMQAFGITLSDSVIEDMINCVQNGSQIELFLGSNPSLHYGQYEEDLKPSTELLDCDLFLTNLNESKSKAHRLPNPTMSILKRPPPGLNKAAGSKPQIRVEKPTTSKGAKGSKAKLPHGKSAMAMALSGSSTTRSLPTSPALTGVGSPLHNPAIAASQQQLEKNKGQRSTLVHELAVEDQTYEYLKEKWDGAEADLTTTLGKVADKIGSKYSMKKIYWKELDVWNYKYEPSENRQKAIENARKQYDKQRLETKDPAWERLLEEKNRGKGIILSKLQAAIAKGNMTPAVKPTKTDDASSKHSSDESVKGKTGGGEVMARSNSQPVGSKPKKVSDRETLSKSLLSNKAAAAKKVTPATKKTAPVSKSSKVQSEKGGKKVLSAEFVIDSSSDDEAPLATTTTTTTSKSKPVAKTIDRPVEKSVERPVEKPKERSPVPPKPKERSPAAPVSKPKDRSPVPTSKPKINKPVIRAPRPAPITAKPSNASTAQKRSRDEEDSSSSSGAPLSKKFKPKDTTSIAVKTLPSSTTLKHRPSDASQNSRGTPSINSYKSKNTSPAKSSPLASSPPTNASDFDDSSNSGHSQHHHDRDRERERERGRERERDRSTATRTNGHVAATNGYTPNGVHSAKKRPAESQTASSQQPSKKSRVTQGVLDKAHRFDKFYEKYKYLHDQLTRLANPPREKVDDLLEMRERLVHLKAEIRRDVEPVA